MSHVMHLLHLRLWEAVWGLRSSALVGGDHLIIFFVVAAIFICEVCWTLVFVWLSILPSN